MDLGYELFPSSQNNVISKIEMCNTINKNNK